MKIIDEIKGKEVLDNKGNLVGTVEDFDWDEISQEIKNFIISEPGVSSKLGMGKDILIPVEDIKAIGEKILANM